LYLKKEKGQKIDVKFIRSLQMTEEAELLIDEKLKEFNSLGGGDSLCAA